ncbi:hypothetical protein [Saccharolobus islandicus]|uniref:hypothetical protein n=1 Tax=Saccharolobus islandicus TaxID=43080 RepID=UPI0003714E94|nr:hypothetical protein [Sulfolobus islandicus]
MNLLKIDFDKLEEMIEKALNERIRYYDVFYYIVIDEETVIVKVYDEFSKKNTFEKNERYYLVNLFTLKMKLINGELKIVEVS